MSEALNLETLSRLSQDLRQSAKLLGDDDVRFVVDTYYALQKVRIQSGNQEQALAKSEEPHTLVTWISEQFQILERSIVSAMNVYTLSRRDGEWARSICGVGPVLCAGFLAHLDISKAPTVGHIWRFAGLDPTVTWGKKEKRPWNASLKVLCWKLGDSFVKVSGRDSDIYGKVYRQRKAQEVERNEAGLFADQAARTLETKKIRQKETLACYEAGKLPPGRIDMRARRYAVKLFLSHLHHVMYEVANGEPPPKPYILSQGGHAHFMAPPNW
jgi:hypothetical protein